MPPDCFAGMSPTSGKPLLRQTSLSCANSLALYFCSTGNGFSSNPAGAMIFFSRPLSGHRPVSDPHGVFPPPSSKWPMLRQCFCFSGLLPARRASAQSPIALSQSQIRQVPSESATARVTCLGLQRKPKECQWNQPPERIL